MYPLGQIEQSDQAESKELSDVSGKSGFYFVFLIEKRNKRTQPCAAAEFFCAKQPKKRFEFDEN